MKKILCCLLAVIGSGLAYSQGIQFTQFNATSLALNPAYTGMMNGTIRGSALYRSQWGSVTVPYISAYASVDGRTKYFKNGDYMGMGGNTTYSRAGDGNLINYSAMGAFAYHKSIGWKKKKPKSVALGVQGGYARSSIDLSKLYFNNPTPPFIPIGIGVGSFVRHWVMNAGAAFSQSLNERVNYIVGVSVNNINQPNDALLKKQSADMGFDMQYTASAGANLQVAERFSLRPAVIYSVRYSQNDFIAGNEFAQRLGRGKSRTYAFLGFWYRSGDALALTAGIAKGTIRVTAAYDYNMSTLNSASNGNGGFEVSLTYLGLTRAARLRGPVECNRF